MSKSPFRYSKSQNLLKVKHFIPICCLNLQLQVMVQFLDQFGISLYMSVFQWFYIAFVLWAHMTLNPHKTVKNISSWIQNCMIAFTNIGFQTWQLKYLPDNLELTPETLLPPNPLPSPPSSSLMVICHFSGSLQYKQTIWLLKTIT